MAESRAQIVSEQKRAMEVAAVGHQRLTLSNRESMALGRPTGDTCAHPYIHTDSVMKRRKGARRYAVGTYRGSCAIAARPFRDGKQLSGPSIHTDRYSPA